jgi:hypothetical protein
MCRLGYSRLRENLEIVYKLKKDEDFASLFVNDLTMAQFLYFILNNENLSKVFKATDSSVVLILGRFQKRKKRYIR